MAKQNQIGTHKTMVYPMDDFINVQYHETVVVAFDHQEIILNNGGWYTKTTKDRINQTSNQFGLGYRVFQKNFDWFVEHQGKIIPYNNNLRLRRKS